MNLRSVVWAFALAVMLAGCGSTCDNAGVAVDGKGDIVILGDGGYVSPNSSILARVRSWPQPPGVEQTLVSQGYALASDGSMYVLANSSDHPNLVYRMDLARGRALLVGSAVPSIQTSIASDDRYAYSVDQSHAEIRRLVLSSATAALEPFIQGPRTMLRGPIAIAVDAGGRICVLDSETHHLLCYAAGSIGDAAPEFDLDLRRLLGYVQVDAVTFDREGNVVVSGSGDRHGLTGYSLAVVRLSVHPKILRTIAGAHTSISAPYALAVDGSGNILSLQEGSDLLVFGPQQSGDARPQWVRRAGADVSSPYRLSVDRIGGDIAILGADGIAFYPKAAVVRPDRWPSAQRLPQRGWDIALAHGAMTIADDSGALTGYSGSPPTRQRFTTGAGSLQLYDPEFVATDRKGRAYVASTDGVITRLPRVSGMASDWIRTFKTPFGRDLDALAVDSEGYAYLASATKNAIVAIDSSGHQEVIAGKKTMLDHPTGLAIGIDGALYVANMSGGDILIFARGAAGDAAPIGSISGPATGLVSPQSLATDVSGKLYVFDGLDESTSGVPSHYVRVFEADARGNVAPIRSYAVTTRCRGNGP